MHSPNWKRVFNFKRASMLSGVVLLCGGCVATAHGTAYAEADAPVVFTSEPTLVEVDSGVWVVRDYDQPVYFVDDDYWVFRDGIWYRSHSYEGGWARVDVNVIPANMIDPVAKNINQFYPIPNRAPSDPFTNTNNFQTLSSEIQQMRQYTIKGDHRFSNANSMFGRYSFFNHKTDNGAGGATIYPDEVDLGKRLDALRCIDVGRLTRWRVNHLKENMPYVTVRQETNDTDTIAAGVSQSS